MLTYMIPVVGRIEDVRVVEGATGLQFLHYRLDQVVDGLKTLLSTAIDFIQNFNVLVIKLVQLPNWCNT